MPYLLALIVLPVLCGCAPALATTAAHQERSPQEIVLAPQQSARVDGTSLSITLEEVVDDSRCPKGVTCVWAGDVSVRIRIDSGNAPAHAATLHLNTAEKETVHGDHRVVLIAVMPYPESDRKIDPATYRATVRVSRTGAPRGPRATAFGPLCGPKRDSCTRRLDRIAVLGARSAPKRYRQPAKGFDGISRAEPLVGSRVPT